MERSVMLGIIGDSGSGKTTVTRGLVRVLGEDQVAAIRTDDYLRYDRRQRAERNITPLDPDCNYLDILAADLAHLRRSEPILKPVYRYVDGTFGAPTYLEPGRFVVVEGLLGFHTRQLVDMFDVRVYLDPSEELRRHWKVQHDCSRRGYTTDQVLSEIDRREPDSERYIRPQRHHADIIVSFQAGVTDDPERLDCRLTLRDTLTHLDLTGVVRGRGGEDIALVERQGSVELLVPGRMSPEHVADVEEALWEKMHFGGDLRSERLGEFTVGTDLHRSDSLAVIQLLILYSVVSAGTESRW
jgi:phosphoribulokinase